jgi:prolyl oligopeptidase
VTRPLYPETARDDVVEILHGEAISDPYRWLEDGSSERVREWTAAENALTEEYLSQVPGRDALRARLAQLLAIGSLGVPTPAGGRYIYQRREGDQNQPVLLVRDSVDGPDRVAVDPNALSAEGTTALDWYHPSPDGRLLAFGLSADGSERSVLHVLSLDTLELLPDRVPHTRAADVAWLPDGGGFYYTRYPVPHSVPEGEEQYHRAIHLHRLGADPAGDPLVFKPAAKEHWPGVQLSRDGRWLLISVARTFDRTDVYLQDLARSGALVPVAEGLDAQFEAQVAHGRLYVRTNLDAPTFRLYVADPERPARERWREIVPARADAVLEGVAVTRWHLALSYLEAASSRLRLASLDAEAGRGPLREIELPTLGSTFGIGADEDGDELFYGFSSYTVPPAVYRVDLATGEGRLWRSVEADVETSGVAVEQVRYASKDGTEVTMFLAHRAGLERDGESPVFLTGYGGFNISMTPAFSRSLYLWIEHGGIVAVPNLRGGGEYGETWHRDGMLGRKQHTFDDMIAAAEWLVAERYTRPGRLAVAGGSNGGLLAGAVLTQRPDLFGAVVIQVPLLDMLRYHRFLLARLWIPEYGDPDDPEEFRWLRGYSPYHHVVDGTPYPAVLLATAESDTRVDPMHARKMAARLQAATSSDRPVLLRLEARAGHGAGKPIAKVLDELTDTWSFVFDALRVEATPLALSRP